MKNIFLEKLHLTRTGKCLPDPDHEKKLSEMSNIKYARQLLDRNCNSKYSQAASKEYNYVLSPMMKLKDISVCYCLLHNGTVQLMCSCSCHADEIFMKPSYALEMPNAMFQAVHCKSNILQEKKQLQSFSKSDICSAVVCDCNLKHRVKIKPQTIKYSVIAFDLTSELGKRKLVNGRHRYNQHKGSHEHLVTSSYERFCNQSSEMGNIASRLRAGIANFPVVYQRNRKIPYCDVHKYHFTKRQRGEFCKQIDLQLKYKVMPCAVHISMLSRAKLMMLSQKKLGMCRVHLQRLSQRTISAWHVKKVTRSVKRLPKKIKQDINKQFLQFKNCFVCLNKLPPHLITKFSSTFMLCSSHCGHSVSNNVVNPCSVSLCKLPRHIVH